MKEKRFKEIVSEGIADLFYIWWQELKAVVKDQGVLIFFILVPLGYPLLYTFIYTNETVREVPAVVVDNNRSTLSREYLRLVDAGPDLHIVSHCADMEEAKALLKEGKAYGIIYIPESFSRDIAKGIQTRVTKTRSQNSFHPPLSTSPSNSARCRTSCGVGSANTCSRISAGWGSG